MELQHTNEGEKIVVPLSLLVVYVPWYRIVTRELIAQQSLFDQYRKFAEQARENGMLALLIDEDKEDELMTQCRKDGFVWVWVGNLYLVNSVYRISGRLENIEGRITLTWSLGSECVTITL